MRFNIIGYYLKEGFRNTLKNKKSTSASLIVMCFTMLIFGVFFMIGENINSIMEQIESAQGIQVFINTDVSDEEVEKIGDDLKNISGVNTITFVSKEDALNKVINLMNETGNLNNKEEYAELVFNREKEGTTGVGDGIAIPHGKGKSVKTAKLVAAVVPNGVNFDSLDGEDVKLIFLIAAPEGNNNLHLEVLSTLSTLLMNKEFKEKLINSKSTKEFLRVINEAEEEKESENKEKQNDNGYELLAITACTTGIAHTYMAAESLENKGKEIGHSIKVETQGQTGTKNKLTKEEIENAKAIIIASDIKIDLKI